MNKTSIIAVDLGGTSLRVGKIQGTEITERCVRSVPMTDNDQVVVKELTGAIETLFDEDVAGIGVGVPSLVDVDRGIVYAVQNIASWKEVHLKDALEDVFRVPVYVNNDANCFAVGECHYGKGRPYRHIVGITIGTGLGSGIIIDRCLYNGANCGAGEIGTIPYKEQTIEYYCSGLFFSRQYGASGEDIFERAKAGDATALQAYDEFGYEMAHAMMTALYAYDPQIVILGGSVSKAFEFFNKTMMEKLKRSFAYQHALERVVIARSELPDVPLLGAAALHLDALEKKTK
jgi:glucokinase